MGDAMDRLCRCNVATIFGVGVATIRSETMRKNKQTTAEDFFVEFIKVHFVRL